MDYPEQVNAPKTQISAKAPVLPSFERIADSFSSVVSVKKHLEEVAMFLGVELVANPKADQDAPTPNLVAALNHYPARTNEECHEIHQLIDQIADALR
ncbi:hypothetical protein [Paraferrimonas sedimenticola]|uniref:Uncharacterized protein n=1 Tax=Paraferrimonas sedimenticola TaxID=375674 RepID=A0AA37VXK9_9GAMM|nr:hypothetical protein [Paraferrimonas sedimenticola]GLP95305.1 hypothetical protein GCM10007895_06110 [Paraferrimonas sedimenticola]